MEQTDRQQLEAARSQRDDYATRLQQAEARLDELARERLSALDARDEERLAQLRADLQKAEDEAEDARALLSRAEHDVANLERACAPRWQALRAAVAAAHAFTRVEDYEIASRSLAEDTRSRLAGDASRFLREQIEQLRTATTAELRELQLQRPDLDEAKEGARRVLRVWHARRVSQRRLAIDEQLRALGRAEHALTVEIERFEQDHAAVEHDVGAETLPRLDVEPLRAALQAVKAVGPHVQVIEPEPEPEPDAAATAPRRGILSRFRQTEEGVNA